MEMQRVYAITTIRTGRNAVWDRVDRWFFAKPAVTVWSSFTLVWPCQTMARTLPIGRSLFIIVRYLR